MSIQLPQKGAQPPIFGPCQLWPNGRPSQLLLSTCSIFKMAAVMDLLCAYLNCACLDHSQRTVGGWYHCAKFGWNWCSRFNNMQVLIFCELGWKTPIHVVWSNAVGDGFPEIWTPKLKVMSTKPQKAHSCVTQRCLSHHARKSVNGSVLYMAVGEFPKKSTNTAIDWCMFCFVLSYIFGRPFVKRFALCYQTVVRLSVCLSVCLSCLSVCNVSVLWPNVWTD